MIQNKIQLIWSVNFFFDIPKPRNIIGFDISTIYRMFGRGYFIDGLCLSRRGKNGGILSSSMVLRKKIYSHYVLFRFFIYLGTSFRFKVTGYTFRRKFIHYSRIPYARW
jgi:hypothetical protein